MEKKEVTVLRDAKTRLEGLTPREFEEIRTYLGVRQTRRELLQPLEQISSGDQTQNTAGARKRG